MKLTIVSILAALTASLVYTCCVNCVDLSQYNKDAKLYTIPLYQQDESYYGVVKVGTPAKQFKIVFDTLTPFSWIKYEYTSTFTKYNKGGYRTNDSKSAKKLSRDGEHDKFSYYRRTGTELEGSRYQDQVNLDFTANQLQFVYQFFGIKEFKNSTGSNAFTLNEKLDGYFGLGAQRFFLGMPTFRASVEAAIKVAHQQTNPYFSFMFNNKIGTGSLILNNIDYSLCSTPFGNLKSHKSTQPDRWELAASQVFFGTDIITPNSRVIIDSGTHFIRGPATYIERIAKKMNAKEKNGQYQVDCKYFNITDKEFTFGITIDAINYGLLSNEYVKQIGTKCYLNFSPHADNSWILGTSFLGAYYTMFDPDTASISFCWRK